MRTLHLISLNNCFVSIHLIVRITQHYQVFIADNDYMILIQIASRPEQRVPDVACAQEHVVH